MSPPFSGLTSSTSPENDGEHSEFFGVKIAMDPGQKQEKIIISAVKITVAISGKNREWLVKNNTSLLYQ